MDLLTIVQTVVFVQLTIKKKKNPVLQQNNREHSGVTKQSPPKMDHEYAVVNKKKQKASYVVSFTVKKTSVFLVVLVFSLFECGTIDTLSWSI